MQFDRSTTATLNSPAKGKPVAGPTAAQGWRDKLRRWTTLEYGPRDNHQHESKRSRRWVRWVADPTSRVRTRMTREGYQFVFLLMFALTAAIIQNVNLLVMLAGSLGAVILLQWRLCSRTLTRISLQRSLPTLIEAKKPFAVDIAVNNPKRWLGCWFLMIRETIRANKYNVRHANENQSLLVNVDLVAPDSAVNVSCFCTCQHRGHYSFRQSEISTRFPFSIMRGIRSIDNAAEFVVHPTFGTLEKNWRESIELPRVGQRHRRLPLSGGDGEFFGLRDYRTGDAMRLIHWRSSAKRDSLIVRQLERQENYEIAILVDLTEPKKSVGRVTEDSKLWAAELTDVALEMSITMIQDILKTRSGEVNFAIADGKPNETFRISSSTQFGALLNRLALSRSTDKSRLVQVARQLFLTIAPGNPVVVLSLRSREEFELDRDQKDKDHNYHTPQIVWINLNNNTWPSYFRRGGAGE